MEHRPDRRSTSSSTAPSPTTRPTRSRPRTSATSRPRCAAQGADLGVGLRRRRRPRRLHRRAGGGHRQRPGRPALIGGELLARHPGRHGALRPALLAGGGRVHPRARRRAGARAGRPLLHEGHPAREGRHLRRRARRPLLLPRQLLRRLRHPRRDRDPQPAAQGGQPLSALVAPLRRYAKSPEINFVVEDKQGRIEALAARYADGEIDYLDGITVQYPTWWFNVRPSNTEPYLRLVLEARDEASLHRHMGEVVALLGTPAD